MQRAEAVIASNSWNNQESWHRLQKSELPGTTGIARKVDTEGRRDDP